jgi:hypothetical protein
MTSTGIPPLDTVARRPTHYEFGASQRPLDLAFPAEDETGGSMRDIDGCYGCSGGTTGASPGGPRCPA